jgi:hypothetical protein
LEDPATEGWITLKLIFKKQDDRHGLERSGSEQGHVEGYCKRGEPLGLIKCGEFFWLAKELLASQDGLYSM